MARERGTLQFFDRAKGYGFITPDAGGEDVAVHVGAVRHAGLEHHPYLNRRDVRVSFLRIENNQKPGQFLALSPSFEE
jgi:cold shock CspA family protein